MDDLDLSGYESSDKGGCYDLWVRVLLDAFLEMKSGNNSASARSFLFDPINPFFDWVSDGLGFESHVLRKRIKTVIQVARPAKVTMRGKVRRRAGS